MSLVLTECLCEVLIDAGQKIHVVKRCKPHETLLRVVNACTRIGGAYPQPLNEEQRHWFHVGRENMKQEINSILNHETIR